YSQTSVQRAFYIPVQYVNLPPNMVILKTNDITVRVIIQGKKDRVMTLKNHHIRVFVDLSHASRGWYTNQIQMTTTELDPSMAVNIEKTTTTLFIDTIEVASLPIKPTIVEFPEKDYTITSLELRPSLAIIKGPSTLLSNLQYIETAPLSLKKVSTPLSTNVPLMVPEGIIILDNPSNQITISIHHPDQPSFSEEKK
ncbi:MAG: CdaR family protein, partial [Brevinematales bacterium]